MGLRKQRLLNGVSPQEAFESNDKIDEATKIGDVNAYGILNSFINIEDYLTRFILAGIGVDEESSFWKENHFYYRRNFSALFSAGERIEILQKFIEEGIIEFASEEKIRFPSDFDKSPEEFFKALRIGFEYRNNLAHEGYINLIGKVNKVIVVQPTILAKKSQLDRGFGNIDLARRLILDQEHQIVDFPFVEFSFQLLQVFTPMFGGSRFSIKEHKSAEELFEYRKGKFSEFANSSIKSKIKKMDKLLSDLVDAKAFVK